MVCGFWGGDRSPRALILDGSGGGYLLLCRMRYTWRVPQGLLEIRARNDQSLEISSSEWGQVPGTVTQLGA